EHRHRRTEFGQQAEALDELALDPQHPPRVGVQPTAGLLGVQQPLVGGHQVLLGLMPTQDHRAAMPLLGGAVRHAPSLESAVGPARKASSARSASATALTATDSATCWARFGSPGPKFSAGMPRLANRATSVQP